MKGKVSILSVSTLGILLVILFIELIGTLPPAHSRPISRYIHEKTLTGPGQILINETMPKPLSGEYEWIELHHPGFLKNYLPTILMNPNIGSQSLPNADTHSLGSTVLGDPIEISGWQLTDEDGNVYTIPESLQPVPPDGFVVIYFGNGTDDYSFKGDNRAVLYTGNEFTNIFEDDGDQVALYSSSTHSPSTLVDFLAWGFPPDEDGTNASIAGLWQTWWYASFETGLGDFSDNDLLKSNESLGRYPGSKKQSPESLAVYQHDQLTPGEVNPVPKPSFHTPEDGAIVETTGFSLGWRAVPGAKTYRFQLDDDPSFNSPVHDTTVNESYFMPLPHLQAGVYYWRVKTIDNQGGNSPWMDPIQVEIVVFPSLARASSEVSVTLGIDPIRQNKDSRMLCLAGDPEGDPTTDNPENAWDAPAGCTVFTCTNTTKHTHGRAYCVRASIRMMASHYGGALSMDRISYHVLEEWMGNTRPGTNDDNPNNDLGHNRGMWYPDEEDEGISWALSTTITATSGKPSFDDIKSYINANRPIMFRNPGHMMVIDGYREENSNQFIHILDPDQPPNGWRWQDYTTQTIDGYWPGPAAAPDVRSDEASVSTDTDGDGIVDFDEIHRFPTSHTNDDSDQDNVPDKQDIREYIYNASGTYNYRSADIDNDGLRKEIDPDNDDGGAKDGCEDANRNGIQDAGETDNFDANDDVSCPPTIDDVFTTDFIGNRKTTFKPGEAIKLTLLATNHQAYTQIVTYHWTTINPLGMEAVNLSFYDWVVEFPPGQQDWWLARGLADTAPLGTYSFTAIIASDFGLRAGNTTFDVQGEPISTSLAVALSCQGVDADTLPEGITDTFSPNDPRVYIWSAWEGADGKHNVKWDWFSPNGQFFLTYDFDFDSTTTLYYTYMWADSAILSPGTWSVKIFLDDIHVETVEFTFTSGTQQTTLAVPDRNSLGAGGAEK